MTDKLAAAENQLAREQAAEIERLTSLVRSVHREYVLVKSSLATVTADRDRLLAELAEAKACNGRLRETQERVAAVRLEHSHKVVALRAERDRYAMVFEAAKRWRTTMNWQASRAPKEVFTCEMRLITAIDSALATSAQDGGKGEGR